MSTVRLSTARRLRKTLLLSMFATLLAFASLPVASLPVASAHYGHVHYLRLISLQCFTPQEDRFFSNGDEPYIKVGTLRVWSSGDMDGGDTVSLLNVPLQAFWNQTTLTLYESDWPDGDDLLGKKTITALSAGLGNRTAEIGGPAYGYFYILTYRVI